MPRRRLVAMLVGVIVAFALVVGRLAVVQGISANRFAAIGVSERLRTIRLAADRGSIFDRAGNELAISVPQQTVWADPHLISDPVGDARALGTTLGIDPATLQARLTRGEHFVYVARKIDDATAEKVRALNIPGVFFLPEPKRFDPAGALAAPVLGVAGADNQGLSGLEAGYDHILSGTPGKLVVEQDPSGKNLPGGYRRLSPSARGSDLVLTLDRSMQYEAEQDLAAEIVTAKAKGGMAAVMDTHTGEILAMASLRAATTPGGAPEPASSNEVVTRVFEPGSILKLATVSGALEEGLINPGDVATVRDSAYVGGRQFSDDKAHPDRQWSVTDILTASSNIGTIGIGTKLKKEGIATYLRRYGFGSPTGVGLPGESRGLVPEPQKWSASSLATISIGQGVAVTALQLVAAYNAVANGGVYVAPKLVKEVIDPSGKMVATPPSPTHRVVSAKTAKEMTAMLSEVVRVGTATQARIDGYTVSGKTGTARKVVGTQYAEGKYVSSFGGFVPAEAPAFTALVVLDEPTPIFGGVVAAPVFSEIARYGLRQFQVPPPPGDPGLFDGVPHAAPTAIDAAKAGGAASPGEGSAGVPVVPSTTLPPSTIPARPGRGGGPSPPPTTGVPTTRKPGVTSTTDPPTTVARSRSPVTGPQPPPHHGAMVIAAGTTIWPATAIPSSLTPAAPP